MWSTPYCLVIYTYVNISLPCPYNVGSLTKVSVLTELTSAGTSHLFLGISWSLIGKTDLRNLVSTVGGTLSLGLHISSV